MNKRQSDFCQAYAASGNAADAARKAGYAESSARVTGAKLLAKDNIRAKVAELNDAANKRAGLTQDRIRKYWQETLNSDDVAESVKATVARDAAKHLNMFVEKIDLTGDVSVFKLKGFKSDD